MKEFYSLNKLFVLLRGLAEKRRDLRWNATFAVPFAHVLLRDPFLKEQGEASLQHPVGGRAYNPVVTRDPGDCPQRGADHFLAGVP